MYLSVGAKLGHYEIQQPLGKGGMGEVYRARDTKLGRDIAIKVLPDELATDEDRLERFGREARLLARVNHPNIATLHGLEEYDGRHVLLMELVEGETLAERIARGPIPVGEAISLFIQIAQGLESAHDKSIVHRDLKPANIKIDPDGNVKILDFGLAKAFVAEAEGSANTSRSPTLTKGTALGAIIGTASYMSPEQARGKSVDRRTDVWAFGCCLYEALTGKKAFEGGTMTDTLAAIVNFEPRWETLPSVPPPVEDVLRRALRKNRSMRLQHVGDARVALREAHGAPEPKKAVSVRHPGSWHYGIALIVTGVLIGWLAGRWARDSLRESFEPRYLDVTLGPEESLLDGVTPVLAISRDGSHLVYNVNRVGLDEDYIRSELVLRRLDRPIVQSIPGTAGARCPVVSPDNERLAFFAFGGQLNQVRLQGGNPIEIVDTSAGCSAAWDGDEHILYLDHPTSDLFRVPADGGDREVVALPHRAAGESSIRWQHVLPDNRGLLYTSVRGSTEQLSVAVLDLETGTRHVLVESATSPTYVPTGHVLFVSSDSLMAAPFDLERLELSAPAVPIVDDVWVTPYGAAQYALSDEGTLAYSPATGARPSRLLRVFRDGTVTPLREDARIMVVYGLAPEGNRLALAIEADIWVYDLRDETLSRVTFDGFANQFAVWSPDGDFIAFSSVRDGVSRIYRVAADGTGPLEALGDGRHRWPSSWSPDGKWLTFSGRDEGGLRDIGVISFGEGGTSRQVVATRFNESSSRFSPDGKWLAYVSDESGQSEVYVRPFGRPGAKKQVSSGGGVAPRWNPRGDELFYFKNTQLVSVRLETGEQVRIRERQVLFAGDFHRSYAVAPSGDSFIMASSRLGRGRREIGVVLNWFDELTRLVPIGPY